MTAASACSSPSSPSPSSAGACSDDEPAGDVRHGGRGRGRARRRRRRGDRAVLRGPRGRVRRPRRPSSTTLCTDAVDRRSSKRLATRGARWRSPGGTPAPAASVRRWTDGSRRRSPSRPGPTRSPTSSPAPTPSTRPGVDADGRRGEGHRRARDRPVRRRVRGAGHPRGARRCEYLTSVTALARAAAAEVLDDWTGGYRDEFVAGMDGDPQASLDALANEVIFRVTEIDDQGLRALTEAATADELQPTGPTVRRPSAWPSTAPPTRASPRSSRTDGCRRWSTPPTPTPASGSPTRPPRRARRWRALPDSVTASFDDPDTVAAAQERPWRSRCCWPPRSPASSASRSGSATATATLEAGAGRRTRDRRRPRGGRRPRAHP